MAREALTQDPTSTSSKSHRQVEGEHLLFGALALSASGSKPVQIFEDGVLMRVILAKCALICTKKAVDFIENAEH